jgi:ATP synthase protein I
VTKINKSIRTQVHKIIFWQWVMIVGFVLVIVLLQGMQKALSALIGGFAYWLPTMIFLLRVTAYAGAQAVMRFLVAFFAGEMVKLFLCGVIILLAARYLPINVAYSIIGLAGAIIAFWITSTATVYRGVKA